MDKNRLKAAEQGKTKYNGKPCLACGKTERFVGNNNCVACAAKHSKAYRDKVKAIITQAKTGE
jgi:hypothetical protein